MSKNLYSKYVTHATIVLDNPDMEKNLSVLEDVFDGDINVVFPLSVVFVGRAFKIKDRDALNTFINTAHCTAELCETILTRKEQQNVQYIDTLKELNTPAKRHVYRDFPGGFGLAKTDELIPNWLS